MKNIYFTPGPSELYFTIEDHIREATKNGVGSISHRSKDFRNVYQHTQEQLTTLLGIPDDYFVLFVSSATEVWERMVQNAVRYNSLHYVNGYFGEKCYHFSKEIGKHASAIISTKGNACVINSDEIYNYVELISMVHNESSTGIAHPLSDIASVRAMYPNALLSLDVVSSAPDPKLDFDQLDMVYFSVQKCFGLPAGLGVWLVNHRSLEKAKKLEKEGLLKVPKYRQLPNMVTQSLSYQTTSTPNVLNIYLLGKVAKDMNIKGIDAIRRETKYKAAVLYQCIEDHNELETFVKDATYQSKTIIVAKTDKEDSIINRLKDNGLVIGKGYGKYSKEHIRIANFPTHSKEQIEQLVDQINNIENF